MQSGLQAGLVQDARGDDSGRAGVRRWQRSCVTDLERAMFCFTDGGLDTAASYSRHIPKIGVAEQL